MPSEEEDPATPDLEQRMFLSRLHLARPPDVGSGYRAVPAAGGKDPADETWRTATDVSAATQPQSAAASAADGVGGSTPDAACRPAAELPQATPPPALATPPRAGPCGGRPAAPISHATTSPKGPLLGPPPSGVPLRRAGAAAAEGSARIAPDQTAGATPPPPRLASPKPAARTPRKAKDAAPVKQWHISPPRGRAAAATPPPRRPTGRRYCVTQSARAAKQARSCPARPAASGASTPWSTPATPRPAAAPASRSGHGRGARRTSAAAQKARRGRQAISPLRTAAAKEHPASSTAYARRDSASLSPVPARAPVPHPTPQHLKVPHSIAAAGTAGSVRSPVAQPPLLSPTAACTPRAEALRHAEEAAAELYALHGVLMSPHAVPLPRGQSPSVSPARPAEVSSPSPRAAGSPPPQRAPRTLSPDKLYKTKHFVFAPPPTAQPPPCHSRTEQQLHTPSGCPALAVQPPSLAHRPRPADAPAAAAASQRPHRPPLDRPTRSPSATAFPFLRKGSGAGGGKGGPGAPPPLPTTPPASPPASAPRPPRPAAPRVPSLSPKLYIDDASLSPVHNRAEAAPVRVAAAPQREATVLMPRLDEATVLMPRLSGGKGDVPLMAPPPPPAGPGAVLLGRQSRDVSPQHPTPVGPPTRDAPLPVSEWQRCLDEKGQMLSQWEHALLEKHRLMQERARTLALQEAAVEKDAAEAARLADERSRLADERSRRLDDRERQLNQQWRALEQARSLLRDHHEFQCAKDVAATTATVATSPGRSAPGAALPPSSTALQRVQDGLALALRELEARDARMAATPAKAALAREASVSDAGNVTPNRPPGAKPGSRAWDRTDRTSGAVMRSTPQ